MGSRSQQRITHFRSHLTDSSPTRSKHHHDYPHCPRHHPNRVHDLCRTCRPMDRLRHPHTWRHPHTSVRSVNSRIHVDRCPIFNYQDRLHRYSLMERTWISWMRPMRLVAIQRARRAIHEPQHWCQLHQMELQRPCKHRVLLRCCQPRFSWFASDRKLCQATSYDNNHIHDDPSTSDNYYNDY